MTIKIANNLWRIFDDANEALDYCLTHNVSYYQLTKAVDWFERENSK